MKKFLFFLTFLMVVYSLEGQSDTKGQLPNAGKFVLFNETEPYSIIGIKEKYKSIEKLMNAEEKSCIMVSTNFATVFFLNQWWHAEVGQDSIFEELLDKCMYSNSNENTGQYSVEYGFSLSHLKNWKAKFNKAQRQNIRFKSLLQKLSLEEFRVSFAIFIKYITKDVKGLDVEIQSYIDAIDAEIEVSELKKSNIQMEVEAESDGELIYSERFTIPLILRNINKLDSTLYPLIDSKFQSTWKEFVSNVIIINQLNDRNNYYGMDDSKVEVQMCYLNQYLGELTQLVNTSSTYYFWTNDKDFYNQNLISQSTIATTLGTADNTPLYTALVDLFPTTIVKRYKVFLDENSDSLNQLKTIDTGKYRNDRGYEFLYVTLDSNQLESGEIPVDSTASVYSDYWEENYSYQNGFSLESSYKRYYNNINEMLDVVNPDLPRMEHVSFVGGSLIFNEGRKDGNYNAYKLNYHQTYGVESMNTLWGQVLGFQIDGGFYANRFMNLSLLTNYTWGELTYSKLPTGGDNFVVNPQRMYQITNSFFTIGTGLNVKIKLSALYLVATGGYQWDISDGRWNYEGEYINSIGKLKMNGGYFELGVGFNVK